MQRILYIFLGALILIAILAGVWFEIVIQQKPQAQEFGGGNSPYANVDNSPIPISGNNTTTVLPGGENGNQNGSTTGSGVNPQATLSIPIQNGKTIVVKDFITNGETVPDTVNPGYYYLAGSIGYCLGNGSCPSGYKTDDFSISYHTADGLFNIILLKEPISQSREEVGIFMRDRLGLSPAQLCNLNYWLSVPASVNAVYAGKNLGFSFCPGATQLPQ